MRTERALWAATAVALMGLLPSASAGAEAEAVAREVLQATGVRGGLVVHLGCGEGRLTAALHASDAYLVHGLDSNQAHVEKARQTIRTQGLYGPVSVDLLTGLRLPYADNLVNLVVGEDLGAVPTAEVMRILAPNGVAYVRAGDEWKKTVKPRPTDIDEWSHYLHDASNNAVAADLRVGPPRHIRWWAKPRYCRSHEFNPSINAVVTAGGRLFYILDEGMTGLLDLRFPSKWSLVARDAFSGVLLWKQHLPDWGYREWNTIGLWAAPLTLSRRVVADDDHVFATLGYKAPVSVLDPATGRVVRTLKGTTGTDEILLSDGVLFLCVRERLSVASPPKKKPKRRRNPHEWNIAAPGPTALHAIDADSGRPLWKRPPEEVTPLTLAAAGGRVCFSNRQELVCLSAATGKEQWRTPCPGQRGSRHTDGTLVIHGDVVLLTGAKGLAAFSAKTGEPLWTGPRAHGPGIANPTDLFVAGGLVWTGRTDGGYKRGKTSVERKGRDLHTGAVRRTVTVPNLISPLHHWRCYRSKATDRYLLLPKRGVEFLDLKGEEHMRHNWLRAPCSHGVVPANGLLYVPPHQCFCYPGVKLTGFNALAARMEPPQGSAGKRLERGPAYDQVTSEISNLTSEISNRHAPDRTADWPMYRHDPKRSGRSPDPVPTDLKTVWQTNLGAKVTPPVIADGRLLLAQPDAHQVVCLDASTGRTQWTFTAGGRVDSAPTVHGGAVLFGSRDGWVYCLRAADGALAWRFRAAPDDRRIVSDNQVESVWPVHGSVLLLNHVAYCTAGRSSYLDGGIHVYGLDPATGTVLHRTRVETPRPDVQQEAGRPFDIEGTRSDLLVTDGEHLYMLQAMFELDLSRRTRPRTTSLGQRRTGLHLLATAGFLDDSGFDRIYWAYWRIWPGYYFADKGPKCGQILVFDETTTYGLHVFTKRSRLSPKFEPGTDGYELFADENGNEPVLPGRSADREKGPGYQRANPPVWSKQIPVRARAMVLAGNRLLLAGPPDVVPEDDPLAAFEGWRGARLWAVSAADGAKLAEYPLEDPPVFDGMAAARGRLFLAMKGGKVICMGSK